jgi:hypothetical protein
MEQNNLINKLLSNFKENTIITIIYIITGVIIVISILYYVYIIKLENRECSIMESIYGTLNGKITSIADTNPESKYSLLDYYIKTAYNCCSGGSYKNDYVNICNLKHVLKQGCRGLDFEIFSINDEPVVATTTNKDMAIKETFNSVKFSEVLYILKHYAFSHGFSPNYKDPIILHLRFKSNNQNMFDKLSDIFEMYTNLLLGSNYSYENHGENFGNIKLLDLMGKIVIIVDKENNSFMENKPLLEYINMTSNSMFMRKLHYYDIKYSPDIAELQDYNKQNMTIAIPDNEINPENPSSIVVRETGCQMIAMRYQYTDNYLDEMIDFFNNKGSAFVLKPERLRYTAKYLTPPIKQDPALSYQPKEITTDYYNFKI